MCTERDVLGTAQHARAGHWAQLSLLLFLLVLLFLFRRLLHLHIVRLSLLLLLVFFLLKSHGNGKQMYQCGTGTVALARRHWRGGHWRSGAHLLGFLGRPIVANTL